MSREVDERVVELQFDNKQFESGVSTTLVSLENLKKALDFSNAGKGIDEIQKSVNGVDFSAMQHGVTHLADQFSNLGVVGLKVLSELTDAALEYGKKIYDNTLGQIISGGSKRALNIAQAQFKMEGLGVDWKKVSDDISYAVDGTAYSFDAAANAAAQFAASGVELGDDMKKALRGISGVAAMTSADFESIASIFTAAAGKGKAQAIELNRISLHGINARKALADYMSTLDGVTYSEADIIDMSQKGTISFKIFAEAMDAAFGEHAKKANETYTGSLSNIRAALARIGAVFYTPIFDAAIEKNNHLREAIVKFKNAMDYKPEDTPAIGTMKSFSEAVDDLAHTISNVQVALIDKFAPAIDALRGPFSRLAQGMEKVSAFGQDLASALGYNKVKDELEKTDDLMGKITAKDKEYALQIWNFGNINGKPGRIDGAARVEALGEAYDRVQKYIDTFISTGYDVAKTDELLGIKSDEAAEGSDKESEAMAKRNIIISNLVETLNTLTKIVKRTGSSLLNVAKALGGAFKDVFDPLTATTDLLNFTKIMDKISQVFEITALKAGNFRRIFRGVFSAFDLLGQGIKFVASIIAKIFIPQLDSMESASQKILGGIASVADWIYHLDQAAKRGEFFAYITEDLGNKMSFLKDKVHGAKEAFEKWSGIKFGPIISKIGAGIKKALEKFKDWTGIDIPAIFSSIWKSIKEFASNIKAGDFKSAFGMIGDSVKEFFEGVAEHFTSLNLGGILKKIAEVIGGIGYFIAEGIKSIFHKTDEATKEVTQNADKSFGFFDIIGGILDNGVELLKGGIKKIKGLFAGEEGSTVITSMHDWFGGLFKTTDKIDSEGDGIDKFGEILTRIGNILRDFYDQIHPIIGTIFAGQIIGQGNRLTKSVENLSKGPKLLANSIRQVGTALKNVTKSFKIETMTRFMKALGLLFIEMVAALAVIMYLDANDTEGSLGTAMLVITETLAKILTAIAVANTQMGDSWKSSLSMAQVIKAIGLVVLEMTAVLVILRKFSCEEMIIAMSGLVGIVSVLDLFMASLVPITKAMQGSLSSFMPMMQMLKQVSLSLIGIVLFALLPLKAFNGDYQAMAVAIEGIAAVMALMAGMMWVVTQLGKTMTPEAKATLTAFGIFANLIALSITSFIPAILILGFIPADKVLQGITAVGLIGLLVAAFMVLAGIMSKVGNWASLLALGTAMILVAAAVNMIVPALAVLSVLDLEQVKDAAIILGTFMTVMALLLGLLSFKGAGALAAGAGLLLLAIAIRVLTGAFILFGEKGLPIIEKVVEKLMGKSDAELKKMTKIMVTLIALLATGGAALIVFGAGMVLLGIGVGIILATLGMAADGVAKLMFALVALSAVWPAAKIVLEEFGTAMAKGLVNFITTFNSFSVDIANSIGDLFSGIMKALLNAITVGIIGSLADAFIAMIDSILASLDTYLPSILTSLGSIIDQINIWLENSIPGWAESLAIQLTGFFTGIFNGLAESTEEHTEAVVNWIDKLINGLANSTKEHEDSIATGFRNFIIALLEILGKVIVGPETYEKIVNFGADVLSPALEGFGEKIFDFWDKLKEFFTVTLPGKISEIWDDLKAFGKEIFDGILQGIKDAPKEAANTIKDVSDELIDCWKTGLDINSPSKRTQELGASLDEGLELGILDNQEGSIAAAEDTADKTTFGFDSIIGDWSNEDMDITKKLNINTDGTSIDTSGLDGALDSSGLMDKLDLSSMTGDLGASFDITSLLGASTSETDKQRHEDMTANNDLLETLCKHAEMLSKSFENGMINIPNNATFNVPVTIDGQQVASATAPYLDVIQATGYSQEKAGVTSW